MTKFEEFSTAFDKIIDEEFDGSLYEFLEEDGEAFGSKLITNLDQVEYDSYGSEDSTLQRVYYFEQFDIHIMFYGTRCSYQGTEWDGYKEVKEVQKTITVWE